MKIALVHDYLSEFGGAEKVLRVLSDMYPEAPIYTAFCKKDSVVGKAFEDRDIRESFLAPVLKIWRLYSPLRFLTPVIWRSMDLSDFDVVITSASWYITRGFRVGKKTKVICYCHTPPRYLYGYETSVDMQKNWIVRVYAAIVNHFLRLYDYWSAQKVDLFVANSINVKKRIEKFYRKQSVVIYPPMEIEKMIDESRNIKKQNFFLIVSRIVGAKGLAEAVRAVKNNGFELKIGGGSAGFSLLEKKLRDMGADLLGWINEKDKVRLMAEACGFIALAVNEDFGMTVVESQAAGTPVIAFNGGGFRESVIDGKTGILINNIDEKTLSQAFVRFNKIKWNRKELQENARRFSRKKFEEEMFKVVNKYA
jgi:glycosyltransferase involved in cell wall biosynthesis